jgi:NAD(P)-dependent dehydrogenase (short-subunit alcohol dehydrogenase family)
VYKEGDMAIVLVTGANRGLGLETSRQLGALGHTVLLGCRDDDKASKAEAALRGQGMDAHGVHLDVDRPAVIAEARRVVQERWGLLDVLVNNAAINYDDWERASAVDWKIVEETLRTNTVSPWRIAVEFLPLLRKSEHGRIVNVSSESGSLARMGGSAPAYSVSKAALNALTRQLAADLRRDRILVNSVCPGWTATDMGGGGRPVEEGARGIVWAATLPDDGPSGGFFRDGKRLEW